MPPTDTATLQQQLLLIVTTLATMGGTWLVSKLIPLLSQPGLKKLRPIVALVLAFAANWAASVTGHQVPQDILANGVLTTLGAVGLHSGAKNLKQALQ